jgi:hypothetical protein
VSQGFKNSTNLPGLSDWQLGDDVWRCTRERVYLPHPSEPLVFSPPTMESSNRIAIIRNILSQYPFSIGIFREIIQNSEDAKASKQVESFRHTFCSNHPNHFPQIFLLDCRVHPPARLSGKPLEHTNGPALLAFNDAAFRPEDWEGILATFGSSKRMDTS